MRTFSRWRPAEGMGPVRSLEHPYGLPSNERQQKGGLTSSCRGDGRVPQTLQKTRAHLAHLFWVPKQMQAKEVYFPPTEHIEFPLARASKQALLDMTDPEKEIAKAINDRSFTGSKDSMKGQHGASEVEFHTCAHLTKDKSRIFRATAWSTSSTWTRTVTPAVEHRVATTPSRSCHRFMERHFRWVTKFGMIMDYEFWFITFLWSTVSRVFGVIYYLVIKHETWMLTITICHLENHLEIFSAFHVTDQFFHQFFDFMGHQFLRSSFVQLGNDELHSGTFEVCSWRLGPRGTSTGCSTRVWPPGIVFR